MSAVKIQNLSFSYGKHPTLKRISCTFESGKFYSVLGPNGSGKTTLLDLISGYLSPDSGTVHIGDLPVETLNKKILSKKIALVSQDYSINFPFLVKEIVLMGRHPYIKRFSQPGADDHEMVENVMALCGISHFAERTITELSGGEKQRCVFARALCQDTPILILDEAFSNMDIRHTLHILRLVKRAVKQKNKTIISVFHDLNIAAAWSDAVLMLKKGELHAFGPTGNIITRETIQSIFNIESIVEFNQHVRAKQIYYPSI